MQYSLVSLAFAALAAANPMPQAVTSAIAPSSTAPSGCSPNYSGSFEVEVVNVTSSSKRDLSKRQAQPLVVTLANGVLTDSKGRTGYIASNYQFQFDSPPQDGAIYTAGWSVCSNSSLALGGSAIFYQCLSGTFYNLYDESLGGQCNEVYIDVIPVSSSSAAATVISDGQVTASAVTQLTDGQPQGPTGVVTQISDGQIQATTGWVISQISDGQIQATTGGPVVTQISDGQIQATTAPGPVITQISDGQIQATTGAVITQISDGQIQATTGVVVSQISDGQVQASTGAMMPTNATTIVTPTATAPVTPTTNAGSTVFRMESFGLGALVLAVALL